MIKCEHLLTGTVVCCILFVLFSNNDAFGQINNPSKSEVREVFKKSTYQYHMGDYHIMPGDWVIGNNDSSYYKSDTIILATNLYSCNISNNCCYFIIWEFTNSHKFGQFTEDICNSYSGISTIKKDYKYNVKIRRLKGVVFMRIYQHRIIKDLYKVIFLDKCKGLNATNTDMEMTLVRMPKE